MKHFRNTINKAKSAQEKLNKVSQSVLGALSKLNADKIKR